MNFRTFAGFSLATFFGCGRFPVAPGTVGTLGAASLCALLLLLDAPPPTGWILGTTVLVTVAGIPLATWCERVTGETDPGWFVLDEVAGYLVAILFLPFQAWILVGAFVFFRIFDIAKPFPIRNLERIGGGVGIMVDDLMAGLYANLGLQLILIGMGSSVLL